MVSACGPFPGHSGDSQLSWTPCPFDCRTHHGLYRFGPGSGMDNKLQITQTICVSWPSFCFPVVARKDTIIYLRVVSWMPIPSRQYDKASTSCSLPRLAQGRRREKHSRGIIFTFAATVVVSLSSFLKTLDLKVVIGFMF